MARPLRERGIQVGVGGFHVSGVLSMLGGVDADLDRAKAMGVSLFAGEAEGRLEEVLRDAAAGTLKPLYNYMDDLPGIEGTPIPLMAVERAQRTVGGTTPASTPGAAVPTSARSAPSSTCRGASRAAARRKTSKRSCA